MRAGFCNLYYWNDQRNWGDYLSPHILRQFAGLDCGWTPVSHAQVIAIGSVLEHVPPLWGGHIIGTGRLFGDSRLHLYPRREATIWGLRGPLSARAVPGSYAIGDPGLLADELVADEVEGRVYDIGVLPHWSDDQLAHDTRWYNKSWETRVISPFQHPLEVVREIARCRKLVTSSLHGIIVADACGIPRRLEYAPGLDKDGGSYKFEDYSLSVKTKLEFGKLTTVSRYHVEDRKHELFDAFQALGREVRRQGPVAA